MGRTPIALGNPNPVLLLSLCDSCSFGAVQYSAWREALAVQDSSSFRSL